MFNNGLSLGAEVEDAMDAERIRRLLLSFRFVQETSRDGKLVLWVGAKALGGKMFALIEIENQRTDGLERLPLLSFSAGNLYEELLDQPPFVKAPYLARARWVALPLSSEMKFKQIVQLLRNAHELTYSKLPKHVQMRLQSDRKHKRLNSKDS
jgi:predicted DNA-binding protein (MmcQ/YjbR family)